ncbi:hypothetical protein FA10DRAFT_264973 [Acaromyces ingoldii]|uniref:HNH nuclease domain-containing protein n=1 Tax=Acaromyces ingoldii TaxID=215250 RepID=A0A316YTK1_9BASI|nr:hypothetical protein FA10DRAFT_264973 [Acaromyces ingoldii]PWN91075.1 hypothetical protein FA10DRAFT_264973 [Acaromyces ingoldii]
MPRVVRARNIHVFSGEEEIAGFYQHGNVSKRFFRAWLDHGWHFSTGDGQASDWALLPRRSENTNVQSSELVCVASVAEHDETMGEDAMMPYGTFDVVDRPTMGPVTHAKTNKVYHRRTMSFNLSETGRRGPNFTSRIRERDQRCLVSGVTAQSKGGWEEFHACHIFARAHLDLWRAKRFASLVTDTGPSQGDAKIDSVQNGLLLLAHHHAAFDAHRFAVDVDRGYEIFDFTRDGERHGRRLLLDHLGGDDASVRPLDALLREHFWQAVLANVRDASEIYEDDGDDDWTNPDGLRMDNAALHSTDSGRQRLELELGNRLNHLVS